jgi:hypothetical protein
MFADYNPMILVSMDDVDNLLVTGNYDPMTPRTKLIGLTGKTAKRIRSSGDTAAGGGISQSTVNKKKKTVCTLCGRHLASSNVDHAYSDACVNYARKHKSGSLHTDNLIEPYLASRTAAFDDIFDELDILSELDIDITLHDK